MVEKEDDATASSIPTDELPSTEDDKEGVFFIQVPARQLRNVRRQPLPLKFGDQQTTPGRVGWAAGLPPPICHTCYEVGHLSPNCKVVAILESEKIVRNFEALSADDRARVPDTSYRGAKVLLDFAAAEKVRKETAEQTQKN